MPWPKKPIIKPKEAPAPKQTLAQVKTSPTSSGAPQGEPWAKQQSQPSPYTAAAHLRQAAALKK